MDLIQCLLVFFELEFFGRHCDEVVDIWFEIGFFSLGLEIGIHFLKLTGFGLESFLDVS